MTPATSSQSSPPGYANPKRRNELEGVAARGMRAPLQKIHSQNGSTNAES
jgi:hypothetical protein